MKNNRITAMLIAGILCLAMLFSAVFIAQASAHTHDINQRQCHICLQIEACFNLLAPLGLALAVSFAAALCAGLLSQGYSRCKNAYQLCSLISLKVKLTI